MADYCLLEEAFRDELVQKEKPSGTKKKKKSAAPAVTVPEEPETIGTDPDRQQFVRPKLVDAMTKAKPAWFGTTDNVVPSSYGDDGFANYDPYRADFMTGFDMRGTQKASALPAGTPAYQPWESMVGGSLLSAIKDMQPNAGASKSHDMDKMQRRLKSIYERLDALETSKRENAQTEVALFVLSGVFFLFSLDLISKLGK
jgi:hypothetical protein